MRILDLIRNSDAQQAVESLLLSGERLVVGEGLWGSAAPLAAGLLASRLDRPLLVVVADSEQADEVRDDLEVAVGSGPDLLPALERLPGDLDHDDELATERTRACLRLLAANGPFRMVATIEAVMQPVPQREQLLHASRPLLVGQQLDRDEFLAWLAGAGYRSCEQVELPGDCAHRGGIVDVFSDALHQPVRIELFDDQIESIRSFDAGTQRSAEPLDGLRIPSRSTPYDADRTTGLTSLLPDDTVIVLLEPTEIQEVGRSLHRRVGQRAGLIPPDAFLRRVQEFTQVHLQRFASGGDQAVRFDVPALPHFEARTHEALETLAALAGETEVTVLCETPAEVRRFRELLAGTDFDHPRISVEAGLLHRGFRWADLAIVPQHEVLHRHRKRRTLRRVQPARPIDSFFDLKIGDHVVHVTHGIGRFRGLHALEGDGRTDEYLVIAFADEAVVHVPVSQIHIVQKYIGQAGRPKLSKLGGSIWKRTKERVSEAVSDLAAELLSIQAARATEQGVAYPQDTLWQREFEAAFPFTETEDQLRAIADIKGDLLAARPMDRLVCGDVGFGKTEVAIRAAFKVCEYGRQVAVLVPTTVLAEQHWRTFRRRLDGYPFAVESLSRFRPRAEQQKIIARTKKGQVDIVIGTHRLLSEDVRFPDLGLVIIDEEQRFGVEAKERLKRFRATVDVLTLSATPIPRTLHMSLLGIRDISSLATPPVDRRAIVSQVRTWDDAFVRTAVTRELQRDGQVYLVHNFVRDIEQIANRIRELVPEARVVVGHGQMKPNELEDVMFKFVSGEANVLVSTNIIESGIDIATANTILIHRAERFGLADLHQLRGRVGRSFQRAYCYLVLSPKHPPKEVAAKRLKAIEQYSDLGAGFQIAMRDLELRGAGNILGPEQSGHIESVGYEMYCQLLEQAVRRLRKEEDHGFRSVNLELGVSASVPKRYIRSDRQRMEVYKRLASAHTDEDVQQLGSDLRDAFGPLPEEVETLLALARIRVLAQPWGIRSIVLEAPDVVFSVDDFQKCEPLFSGDGPGSPRMPDARTIHWRLPRRLLDAQRLLPLLAEQLAARGSEGAGQQGSEGAREQGSEGAGRGTGVGKGTGNREQGMGKGTGNREQGTGSRG